MLGELDDEQWAAPSRCDGWSSQDVIAHLVTANQFWTLSIASGLRGEPTTFLRTFDPVASPAQMVESVRSNATAQTLEEFVASQNALAAVVESLDGDAWSTIAEAPPGHLPIRLVVLHALWDSWIHERDIAIPLGLTTPKEPDEIAASLRYAAALGPAFLASTGATRRGTLEVIGTEPDVRFAVDTGRTAVVHDRRPPDDAVRLEGTSVALLEAVSYRAPLDGLLAPADRWMLDGLGEVFDVVA
jgi:uncharacterized protein (TIGR03083 family)